MLSQKAINNKIRNSNQVWTEHRFLEIGLEAIMYNQLTPTPTLPIAPDSIDDTLREMSPRVTNLQTHLLPNFHGLVQKELFFIKIYLAMEFELINKKSITHLRFGRECSSGDVIGEVEAQRIMHGKPKQCVNPSHREKKWIN